MSSTRKDKITGLGKNRRLFELTQVFLILFFGFFISLSQACSREKKNASHEKETESQTENKTQLYHCPMHPSYVSDKPGDCPICGMKLVKIKRDKREEKKSESERSEQKTLYHCPMHPSYISDKPGDCPICGMKLVPVKKEKKEEHHHKEEEHHYHHEHEHERRSSVDEFEISRITLGLKFVKVQIKNVSKEMRGAGIVELDERRIKSISLKYSGWIEELYANYEGKFVSKGTPLLKIYSPDLAASIRDYITVLKTCEREGKDHTRAGYCQELLESSKTRLQIYGVSEKDIADLVKKSGGKEENVSPYFVVRSPVSGFIMKKNVFEGQFISPETELFRIADLSHIWVIAEFYENDIKNIKNGYNAVIKSDILGFETQGQVSYIYPYIDPQRRTVRVRIDVENKDLTLKPGMYVSVYLNIPIGRKVVVPEDSVLWSGEKHYVFVKGVSGRIIPREVVLGDRVKDGYVVESGLSGDEEIVASGTFLIDSEIKLKSAIERFKQGGDEIHQH